MRGLRDATKIEKGRGGQGELERTVLLPFRLLTTADVTFVPGRRRRKPSGRETQTRFQRREHRNGCRER